MISILQNVKTEFLTIEAKAESKVKFCKYECLQQIFVLFGDKTLKPT